MTNNTVSGGDGVTSAPPRASSSSRLGCLERANNTISGTVGTGRTGLGFGGLEAGASVTVSGNTITTAGGVGLGFLNNLATAALSGNVVSDTWSEVGGELTRAGLGIALVDSSAITLTENAAGNAFAGVLIDPRWDDAGRGVARLTITDTTSAGNNQGTGATWFCRTSLTRHRSLYQQR